MATSSFFYNGSNAPQDNPNTPAETTGSSENTVKTSFFYEGVSPPPQTSVSDLLIQLDAKLAIAQEASNVAVQAAGMAQAAAGNAEASQAVVANLLVEAKQALTTAQAAQTAAEAALSLAQATASSVSNNAALADAARVLAEIAASNAAAAANSPYVINVASDLAGHGFNYDLGLVSDSVTVSPVSTPKGYIQTVAEGMTDVHTVATNMTTVSGAMTSAANAATSAANAANSATAAANSAAAAVAAGLPSQTGNSGKYLKTNGSSASWAVVDSLPTQTGNAGKYLTTNGSAATWATLNVNPATVSTSGTLFGRTDTGTYAPPTAFAYNGTVNETAYSIYADVWGDYLGNVSGLKGAVASGVFQVGMPLSITCFNTVTGVNEALDCGVITAINNTLNEITITWSNAVDFSNMQRSNGFWYYKLMVSSINVPGLAVENVTLGHNAGLGITTGGENVVIGDSAGNNIRAGRNNVVIGNSALASAEDVNNEVTLGNSAHTKTRLFGALALGGSSVGTAGQVLTSQGPGVAPTWTSGAGVTSVNMSVPTGFSVSGGPITSSGTLAVSFASGYSIPTDAKQTNWDTAYGWGNHASAGYLTGITSGQVTGALGFTPENAAKKNTANGYAGLDSSGLVPSSLLPSYVDDVLEYVNLAGFPGTGETGKIYVAKDTNKIYRWSGSTYVEISASPGSTDAVTEGSTNLYFTNARARSAISATGSLSYNSTTGVLSYTQPTNVSTFTNDSGYVTQAGARSAISATGSLSYNSTTGVLSYTQPTNVSTFTNDAGYLTSASLSGYLTSATAASTYVALAGSYANPSWITSLAYSKLTGAPTAVSSFTNDSGYVTQSGARSAISATGSLSYNSTTGVISYTAPTLATVATTGAYSDLTGKPTNVSSFTNDSGYVTRTISVNDTSDGLRITQAGTGNSFVVEDSTNPDSTPFVIDNAGNVGVGTTTMVAKMNVAQTYDSVLIQATNGTVGHRVSYILSNVAYTGTSNAYPLALMTVGTEAMRIDTSQRVGIGKTNPGTLLDVNGVITATGGTSTNWNTAYGWGNHASAGYLTSATAATTYASLTGSYADPSWITSLAYSKLTGAPTIDTLAPTQTGNSGKFLTTNGTSVSWGTVVSALSGLSDVTLTSPASGQFLTYNGTKWVNSSAGNGTVSYFKFVATAAQTTFSGLDASSKTLAYTIGFIDVIVNGVIVDPSDYTASNGTSIVFGSGLVAGDEVRIKSYGTFNVANIDGANINSGTVTTAQLASILDLGVLP
jgi:hypothetical protein